MFKNGKAIITASIGADKNSTMKELQDSMREYVEKELKKTSFNINPLKQAIQVEIKITKVNIK